MLHGQRTLLDIACTPCLRLASHRCQQGTGRSDTTTTRQSLAEGMLSTSVMVLFSFR